MKRILLTVIAAFACSCERQDDAITEKSPFREVIVETPSDGAVGVVRRSKSFAEANGMRFQHSFEHFSEGEYSVLMLRPDLNIATENVLRGQNSVVSAYARNEPSSDHRTTVENYLCGVMRHGCKSDGALNPQPPALR